MTIRDIIRRGEGKAHSWRVEREGNHHALYHYSTQMLIWYRNGNHIELIDMDLGHGSVSDQNGMNIAFRELGAPHLYYSRKGGAHIVNQEGN